MRSQPQLTRPALAVFASAVGPRAIPTKGALSPLCPQGRLHTTSPPTIVSAPPGTAGYALNVGQSNAEACMKRFSLASGKDVANQQAGTAIGVESVFGVNYLCYQVHRSKVTRTATRLLAV